MCYLLTPPLRGLPLSVGLYLPSGGMRMFECPRWVSTLRAAEFWGWVQGIRLATYMKWPRVCVGGDSIVARY